MGVTLNCTDWAQDIFGDCQLNDKRLTRRLQKVGAQVSSSIGSSLAFSCNGNNAALEGSYRLIRNKKVTAEQIAEGGYRSIIKHCKDSKVLLAVEDTTTVAFAHKVKEQLGDLGGPADSYHKGFIVHSSLLIDGETENTIGLIDQNRWCRNGLDRGQRHQRRKRSYLDKESYKWEENSRRIAERLGKLMPRVISVCDRELLTAFAIDPS